MMVNGALEERKGTYEVRAEEVGRVTYDPQKGRWPEPVTYCIDFDAGDGLMYGVSTGTHVGEAIASFRIRWEDPVVVHDAYPLAFEEKIWGTDES